MEHEGDSDTNYFGALGTIAKTLETGVEKLEIRGKVESMKITEL